MSEAPTGFSALDPCVHCGFCLPACPTYLVTGDEADSPRGRIVLMRALERGEIPATDPALTQHLDACLGCRGCEPACPSGVGYGRGLEAARVELVRARGLGARARAVLAVFRREWLWRPLFTAARWLRRSGIPSRLSGSGTVGFSMGMLSASRSPGAVPSGRRAGPPAEGPTVVLFRGCVMDTLFTGVHDAARRTLEVNGYRIIEVGGQGCCGALHEHAGDRESALALAAANVAALADAADFIAVDSAGCGALLRDYGHLLGSEAAAGLASKVRDVTELLAARGPRPGGALPLTVAYDAPCHLQHAQGVQQPPLEVLRAIAELELRVLPGSDRCCGSAGIYSLLQPAMSRAVLDAKIATLRDARSRPQVVATGNPGCLMQIGAGLRAAGLEITVAHPVDLLDRAYEVAGYYRG